MIKVNGDRFVVTGGAGFIGSHIAEELVKQGKRVTVIDNVCREKNLAGWWNSELCAFENLDVRDILLSQHPIGDVVFHEACSKCTVCKDDPARDLLTNAWGSFEVFDVARHVKAKVIHASTGSVYGDNVSRVEHLGWNNIGVERVEYITDENTQYAPKSFYGVSKLAGEQYLRAFKEYYGLRFVGLRYFHVFGPRQDSGPNGGVVAIFITRMLKGEPITVYGDGNQTRSFTYVKDVVAANFHAANSTEMEGEYYNVASGISVTLNELIEALSEIMDVKPKVEYQEARKGDIKLFNVSNHKLAQAGYSDWTNFKDALTETVEWYRANS